MPYRSEVYQEGRLSDSGCCSSFCCPNLRTGHDLPEQGLCLYVVMVPAIQQGLDEEGIEKNAFLAGRHDRFLFRLGDP